MYGHRTTHARPHWPQQRARPPPWAWHGAAPNSAPNATVSNATPEEWDDDAPRLAKRPRSDYPGAGADAARADAPYAPWRHNETSFVALPVAPCAPPATQTRTPPPAASSFAALDAAAHGRAAVALMHARERLDARYACAQCGARVERGANGAGVARHVDAHFREAQRVHAGEALRSRAWYAPRAAWAAGAVDTESGTTVLVDFDAKGPRLAPVSSSSAAPRATVATAAHRPAVVRDGDGDTGACAVCGERLERAWSDDAGAWLYAGAVEAAAGGAMHEECLALGGPAQ